MTDFPMLPDLHFDEEVFSQWTVNLLTTPPDYSFHMNDGYMFCVHVSGGHLLQIDQELITLEPYQLLPIPPHSLCRFVSSDPDAKHEWLFMHVPTLIIEHITKSDTDLADILSKSLFHPKRQLYVPPLEYLHMKRIINTIDAISNDVGYLDKLESYNYMSIILCRLCRSITSHSISMPTNTADALMQNVHNHIRKNFAGDCTLEALAARFGVNKFHLSHRFSQTFGITLHQFVLRCRIAHAQLLICQREPMANLAIRSGFNDYSTFIRAFSSSTGMTPAKWRDLHLRRT